MLLSEYEKEEIIFIGQLFIFDLKDPIHEMQKGAIWVGKVAVIISFLSFAVKVAYRKGR